MLKVWRLLCFYWLLRLSKMDGSAAWDYSLCLASNEEYEAYNEDGFHLWHAREAVETEMSYWEY